jgi:hypothetical protein
MIVPLPIRMLIAYSFAPLARRSIRGEESFMGWRTTHDENDERLR